MTDYIHVTYGRWVSSGHQCWDLVTGGCDEPVPSREVTVHSVNGSQVIGDELGTCVNRCGQVQPPVERKPAPGRDEPISVFGFSVRVHNCLRRDGIHTVRTLLVHSVADLAEIRNFGPSALAEVQSVLAAHGLELKS